MNIITQLCGIALLTVVVFFYRRQKKVDFRSSYLFNIALEADLSCLFLDILSIVAIIHDNYYGGQIAGVVTAVICKLYLMALIFMLYIGFDYTVSQMPITQEGEKKIAHAAISLYIFIAVLIAVLPIYYWNSGDITYSYGPACIATYFFAAFFILATLIMALYYRKRIPRTVFATIMFLTTTDLAVALIQFIFPQVLVVGFGSALGLCVIYLELENPGTQIDKITGLFNLSTFQLYIEDFNRKNLQFSYIFIKLIDDLSTSSERYNATVMKAASYFGSLPHSRAFYDGQHGFFIIFHNPKTAEETADKVNRELKKFCHENRISFLEGLETEGRRADSVTEILEILGLLSVNGEYSDSGIITLTESMYERMRQERSMSKEIENAIEEGRVEAFFQPIYSIDEDAFTGAEALVRIRREDGTIIPPGMFIPVAEKTGQVTNIGDIMFEQTLALIKNGELSDLGVKFIDINLSVLQCEDDTLSSRYLKKMIEAGVPPQMFCFEITETAMIVDRDSLLNNLNAFRDAGCSCSLDDFGNGESNLNYVVDMPINFIKADRSMVTKYTESSRVGLIMDSMIHMANGLSLKIVAEGVETVKDLDAMKHLKVDYIQGFYFSKPLPKDEYIRFLRKNKKSA
ncbi:MAG: EAL domain-containing protein [bacterium LCO1.1]|uniref:EAL domain-containing protein n=1 Tax=Candidatus Weimeria bifida TaxID=2599074 RepID=A0A6N7IYA1_9FIRM|nr:EAL domain-containing protein [Candidatus Weimeria bifida]